MDREAEELELFIAQFLRYGVLVAGGLMLIGWLSQISFSQDVFERFHTYQEYRLGAVLSDLWRDQNWGLMTAYSGMFVLISLPILRVLMTFAVFLKKRDFAMAAVSALVLLGLTLSVALGFEI